MFCVTSPLLEGLEGGDAHHAELGHRGLLVAKEVVGDVVPEVVDNDCHEVDEWKAGATRLRGDVQCFDIPFSDFDNLIGYHVLEFTGLFQSRHSMISSDHYDPPSLAGVASLLCLEAPDATLMLRQVDRSECLGPSQSRRRRFLPQYPSVPCWGV
ncbi:hypothetical protein SAMD00019534_049640 [Acytostelium subglobosum LB1]|uniref:hypothetical protein n=1 Tax=Acytostelium subglobosum LB1 TaxID=1410327 RepID=UPI000644D84A|nr:hypothetical protein SAMD00019534_049640 [Acytostelium subglobosum LB1]GAM21789.1 hypothetical protein SAMD00019534_049640 [Acytostelium subglobosum LB1]|eukprot:XP_012754889.1 hypothetical protein SAMD00019534_049640 [Acytostelium subglobosum LB1]